MHEQQPWYVTQRAEALALVSLTSRNDVIIRPEHERADGLDLVVEVVDNARPARRVFGVQLQGRVSIAAEETETETFTIQLKDQAWLERLPLPVCQFLFSVKDSVGFYRWLSEPVIDEDGEPKLRLTGADTFKKLDTAALAKIVAEVNQWYDALVTALAA